MLKKIDKVLAAFGNIRAMKRTHVDTYTEGKINEIKGDQIAGNNLLGIWITFNELAGYKFLELAMLSRTEIKTFKGVELSFLGGEVEMYIDSDTKEISSDFSNVSNRWLTHMSFEVSDEDIDFITKKEYEIVQIESKKKQIRFKTTNNS